MSDHATTAAPPAQRLRFRLIGSWYPVLLGTDDDPTLIPALARDVIGKQDVDANVRAELARSLREAVAAARRGGAEAMFIGTEIRPGLPMSANLTVFPHSGVRMSPAIGSDPAAVMDVFEQSLRAIGDVDMNTAERLTIAGSEILRTHRLEDSDVPNELQPEGVEGNRSVRRLVVDYWYTVPETKDLLLVNFMTPMGDIAHVMLAFFDAIVRASYFEQPSSPQGEIGAPTPT